MQSDFIMIEGGHVNKEKQTLAGIGNLFKISCSEIYGDQYVLVVSGNNRARVKRLGHKSRSSGILQMDTMERISSIMHRATNCKRRTLSKLNGVRKFKALRLITPN